MGILWACEKKRQSRVNQVPKQQYINKYVSGEVRVGNNNVRYGTSFFCRFEGNGRYPGIPEIASMRLIVNLFRSLP